MDTGTIATLVSNGLDWLGVLAVVLMLGLGLKQWLQPAAHAPRGLARSGETATDPVAWQRWNGRHLVVLGSFVALLLMASKLMTYFDLPDWMAVAWLILGIIGTVWGVARLLANPHARVTGASDAEAAASRDDDGTTP